IRDLQKLVHILLSLLPQRREARRNAAALPASAHGLSKAKIHGRDDILSKSRPRALRAISSRNACLARGDGLRDRRAAARADPARSWSHRRRGGTRRHDELFARLWSAQRADGPACRSDAPRETRLPCHDFLVHRARAYRLGGRLLDAGGREDADGGGGG